MTDDQDFLKLLGAHQAETEQQLAAMRDIIGLLVAIRGELIAGGFTTTSAEKIARDWFHFLLDNSNPG